MIHIDCSIQTGCWSSLVWEHVFVMVYWVVLHISAYIDQHILTCRWQGPTRVDTSVAILFYLFFIKMRKQWRAEIGDYMPVGTLIIIINIVIIFIEEKIFSV